MIYFIQCNGSRGPIKIGYTKGPLVMRRLKSMKTDNPYPLVALATIQGTPAREREIQDQFIDSHIEGEWYRPSHELIEFIKTIQDGTISLPSTSVFTKQQKEMTRLYLNGFTQSAIARRLGISRQAVHAFIKPRCSVLRRWHGHMIEPPSRNLALIEVMTISELAVSLGISRYALAKAAKENRIEARKSGGIWLSTAAAVKAGIEAGRLRPKEKEGC